MNLICNLFSSLFSVPQGDESPRGKEQRIDASIRFGVLWLIKGSVTWLLLASLLGLIAAVQITDGSYLAEYSFLTYGKVSPAFWNVLIFGWLFNAGFATLAWIVSRLGGRPSGSGVFLAIATGAWNFAVLLGVIGIFAGHQQPYRLLEFPAFAAPFVLVAFGALGLWVVLAFKARAYRSSFASQWYALSAIFSFVWIYTIAQVMVFCSPAQGVFQAVVASWFNANLIFLVLAPFGLATAYYLVPKLLGKPLVGYRQSGLAFWSWVAFASCSGLASLVNGPFPAWLASVGVMATFALLFPLSIFSMQFLGSLLSNFMRIWETVSLRFVFFGAFAFLVSMLFWIFGSLRIVQETVQFSHYFEGVQHLFLVGFVGMTLMGAHYYILPRLLNKELPTPGLIDVQFWIQGFGIFAIAVGLIFGGIQQGSLYNGSLADAADILYNTRGYQYIAVVGSFLFALGSFAYAVTFTWILLSPRKEQENEASLIEPAPELEYTHS